MFICHSSTRGVVELLRDLFDYRISLGTMHNIVHSPVAQARRINQQYDLSTILIGLLDEIFQAADPVLVGVDAASTFCFLLSPEEHRDADTWGIRLMELVDRGFAPQATIADFASGLRAGHQEALPEVPCRGDVFHALYNVGLLARYLENRAYEAIDARAKLERKQATAKRRHGRKDQSLATKLLYARPAEAKAIALADEVALLARWLRDDILSVAGPEYAISAVICWTSWWRSCAPASRPVRSGSGREGPCWRTSGTIFWPSLWNWTVNWRPWPKSGRSV